MPYLQNAQWMLLSGFALCVPVGLALLAIGAAEEERAEQVATTALLALATAVLGYLVCGFAFQYGGAAFVSGLPGLGGLTAEWSPFDLAWGPGWGLIGLRGFFLRGEAYTPDAYLLFAANLPAVICAVLVALLALVKHIRRFYLPLVGLLVSGLLYPLFGNWVWGGGWLANLGLNLGLGHGFVDAAGAAGVFLLGTCVALAVLLLLRPLRELEAGPARLPPIHFPLLMVLGALLALLGWPALILANPLFQGQIVPSVVLVNLVSAAAGSVLVVLLYSWFVTGKPNALAAGRGTVAGLVAASAVCAFVPAWSAWVIGAVAGALLLLGLYVWEQRLRLDDPSAAVATFALPAIWSLLAVAIFADGRWGAGWNGVGVQEYLGIPGQGVTGWLLAPGYQRAGPGQFQAQVAGFVALLVLCLLVPWLLFRTIRWVYEASQRAPAVPMAEPEAATPVQAPSEAAGEGSPPTDLTAQGVLSSDSGTAEAPAEQ